MSNQLTTASAADVAAQAFIDSGNAANPDVVDSQGVPTGSWPAYVGIEPEGPDNLICLKDSQGAGGPRSMIDGVIARHYGVQVLVRATDQKTGIAKAQAVQHAMESSLYGMRVTIDSVVYVLNCFSNIGDVIPVGLEDGSNRFIHTINVSLAARQV